MPHTENDVASGSGAVPDPFWTAPEASLFDRVTSGPDGLDRDEAARRSAANSSFHAPTRMPGWRLMLRQLDSPIVLLLLAATALSMGLGDLIDGGIILAITAASASLGFVQERGAVRAVEELLASVRVHADVRRSGAEVEVTLDDVVVGDLLILRAGDVIAGDARVLDADSLLVDESALTGESFPVEKRPGVLDAGTVLAKRSNSLWSGTHIVSGSGRALVVCVGGDTEFGRIRTRLAEDHVPTAFELGLRRFGLLIMRTAGLLVAAVFVVNVVLGRSVVQALLFSLALAVGLTPQLLPTIVTVTLAHGARRMARRQVIVKRLDAIEDIGAIDVLCTDKTGTLTNGTVTLDAALDPEGNPSDAVRRLAWINATGQRSFPNPIDQAIASSGGPDDRPVPVLDEIPYDFGRRLLTLLVLDGGAPLLITKGALESVLSRCAMSADAQGSVRRRFEELSADGYRVLGLATRSFDGFERTTLDPEDESGLEFAGLLCFSDPPKADAVAAIAELASLGVVTKLITGDNRFAAIHAATAVGLDASQVLTGADLAALDPAGRDERIAATSVFAEIEPLDKEAIVASLRRSGHTVGYLGDGINDAPSLLGADVGISVDRAVDVAKYSAAVVLLDKDLAVLAEGIREGRQVLANTLKYVQVTISANFGNMISMAAATAFLPFLPLLPRQILLLNFLSDIPGVTIAGDRVDPEAVVEPHGWDNRALRRFMIVFGLISSVFDIGTFLILRLGFGAGADLFRTGWFIESTATELAVMLVLRTRRPAWRSRPGTTLLVTSGLVAVVTVGLPFTALAADLGLSQPSIGMLGALAALIVGYVAVTEWAKQRLWRPTRSTPTQAVTVDGTPQSGR